VPDPIARKYQLLKGSLLTMLAILAIPLGIAAQVPSSQGGAAEAGHAEAPGGFFRDVPAARPGDRVVLKIWNEPEMSDTFTVSHSGSVILPRLGAVQVDDVPIVQLEDSLRSALGAFLRNPSVEVVVLRRISVLGEVRVPGIYLADLTMGLPEMIARAGGPTEIANTKRITVVRGAERLEFRGNSEEAIFVAELHSGDQVIVGRRNFFLRNPWAAASTALTVITLISQLGR
jgi:hypothetical protein